jgi:hypothetical protein
MDIRGKMAKFCSFWTSSLYGVDWSFHAADALHQEYNPQYQMCCRMDEVQSQCEHGDENLVPFLGSNPGHACDV